MALLIATQNFMVLGHAGRPIPWSTLAAGELPVWYIWLGLYPGIRLLALRYPPFGQGFWRNLGVHFMAALLSTLVMIVAVTAVRTQLEGLIPARFGFWDAVRSGFVRSFLVFLPIYGILVTGVLAWNFYQDAQVRALKESRLEAALASARLESLRDQIHPHFLFNTLHAISALMADDVSAARRMMRRLSELLRVALEETTHEVTLEEELRVLELYVEIQQIRFGDRLNVRYDIDPAARRMFVPRIVLQPLVENAIKHGTGGRVRKAVVVVHGELRGDELRLEVRDDGPGFSSSARPGRKGIGLSNTEARLEQLYGSEYALELENAAEGGAVVRLIMPARSTPRLGVPEA